MIMKALLMIRYVATKEVTIQALGADHKNETLDAEQGRQHFNRVFQYIKDKEAELQGLDDKIKRVRQRDDKLSKKIEVAEIFFPVAV